MAVQIEYSFKSVAVRRATGIMAKESEWNPNENHRRGGVRSNYGPDYRSVNNRLLKKVTDLDTAISEWCNKYNRKNEMSIFQKRNEQIFSFFRFLFSLALSTA